MYYLQMSPKILHLVILHISVLHASLGSYMIKKKHLLINQG